MNRRSILGTLAAAPVASAPTLAGPVAAEPDPHGEWSDEFFEVVDYINTCGDPRDVMDTDDGWAARELEMLIAETPATTLAGVLAQLRFAERADEEDAASEYAVATARENAIVTLERIAGDRP